MIRALSSPAGWLSFASGCLIPIAFAPFDWWPLAYVGLAGLFAACRDCSPAGAFRRGWLFGLGMFGFGVSWVQVSIHQFGLPQLWFSASITALFVALLAAFTGLVGLLTVALSRRVPAALAFTAVWTLGEWLRSWILTGFPWLLIGYSQIGTPLDGWAPIGGVLAVSFNAALLSALAVEAVYRRRRQGLVALAAMGLVLLSSLALRGVEWSRADGSPIDVALVQGNVEQSVKWQPEQREPTLHLYRELSASHWDKDLIVWPETAVPAFSFQVADFLESLAHQARETATRLLVGIPFYDPERRVYFNSILVLGGETRARYDKRHLVPFGEYLPLRPLLEPALRFLSIPMSQFAPGPEENALLPAGGWAIGASICYEDAFGELVAAALPEAAVLVNVSNDAWFGDSLAPHQHLQIARMRARESARYLLRATNNGISALIDERGAVLARSPQFERYVLSGTVQPRRGGTPYGRWQNRPIVALCVVCLLIGWLWGRSRQPGEPEHQ